MLRPVIATPVVLVALAARLRHGSTRDRATPSGPRSRGSDTRRTRSDGAGAERAAAKRTGTQRTRSRRAATERTRAGHANPDTARSGARRPRSGGGRSRGTCPRRRSERGNGRLGFVAARGSRRRFEGGVPARAARRFARRRRCRSRRPLRVAAQVVRLGQRGDGPNGRNRQELPEPQSDVRDEPVAPVRATTSTTATTTRSSRGTHRRHARAHEQRRHDRRNTKRRSATRRCSRRIPRMLAARTEITDARPSAFAARSLTFPTSKFSRRQRHDPRPRRRAALDSVRAARGKNSPFFRRCFCALPRGTTTPSRRDRPHEPGAPARAHGSVGSHRAGRSAHRRGVSRARTHLAAQGLPRSRAARFGIWSEVAVPPDVEIRLLGRVRRDADRLRHSREGRRSVQVRGRHVVPGRGCTSASFRSSGSRIGYQNVEFQPGPDGRSALDLL